MIDDEIKKAVDVLKNGGIILYPSDTIWGVGCDALNVKAIKKVEVLKKRGASKNLIILVNSIEEVKRYVKSAPPFVDELIESFTRPLTIIYPDAKNLPDTLISDDGSVGVRVVKNKLCEDLIKGLGKPMVSTSANISGIEPPLTYSMISDYIKNGVDHILNIRQEQVTETKPSTIIKLNNNNDFTVIRE